MQPKLEIGEPNDPLEREADTVADQVLRMSEPGEAKLHGGSGTLQRKCNACMEEEEENRKIARKEVDSTSNESVAVPSVVHDVLQEPGRPLEPETRAFFEPRFGRDFSRVRVHTDDRASDSARKVHSAAYTVGQHVVFASGNFVPHVETGRRLLAHELAHVVQQGAARSPWSETRGQRTVPNSRLTHLVQNGLSRAPEALQKKESPRGKDKKPADPVAEQEKEVFAALSTIEENWKTLSAIARKFSELKTWVVRGNAVVKLIRSHTEASLAASQAGDSVLVAAYKAAVESDKTTYDYIAWHVTAYVNLVSARSWVNGLVNAFDHDNREFKGRKNAERITRELKKAVDGLPADSEAGLSLLRTDVPLVAKGGASGETIITVTSAAIGPDVAAVLKERTEGMQKLQINVQLGTEFVNEWLDDAFEQGLVQAQEALEEYAKVRSQLGGKKRPKKEKSPKPEDELGPRVAPIPLTPPEDDRKKQPAVMRFQVQWNSRAKDPKKKGQFSERAEAPASIGVTTKQAVAALKATHAQVRPRSAQTAAEPAVSKQTDWINSRPPAGISQGGYSHSEYFEYDYPDARVDVENLRGHNLKV
jgi:hypothetical protein